MLAPSVVESVDQADLAPEGLNNILEICGVERQTSSLKLMYYILSTAFGQHRSGEDVVKFSGWVYLFGFVE